MALELVFECPRTLGRLRTEPLGKLLDGFCSWLFSSGFRRETIRKHLFNVSHLNEHLANRKNGFSEGLRSKDIDRFFNAYSLLCQRRGGLEGHVRRVRYRTLLGLLYSTGIRIGEASALNLEHLHSGEQMLYIAEGKFRKSRWLPLSDSTCQALQQYSRKRLRMSPRSSDSPFFINQRSSRLHHCTVNQTFRHLLRQCNIHHSKRTGPRIHDIRHTFAVRRLLAWYRDGQNVNARLPWLATYMGHVDIHSTQHQHRGIGHIA